MITGFNHNIKYKDSVFHVQTEDSGVEKAHMITLLYFGGNIVERTKTSYADMISAEGWEETVAGMMQKQHKDMLRSLIRGSFDAKIEERSAGASFLDGPAPLNVAAGSQHQGSFGIGGGGSQRPAAPAKPAQPTPAAPAAPLPAPVETAHDAAAAAAEADLGDGSFTVSGSLWESLLEAAPVILAEDMEKALESDDDAFVFGEEKSDESLDDMMLGFMKSRE